MMSCGDAVSERHTLLSDLRPKTKSSLETEVEVFGGSEGQGLFGKRAVEPFPPRLQHLASHARWRVRRTPEDLRSEDLKPTEAQHSILCARKHKNSL